MYIYYLDFICRFGGLRLHLAKWNSLEQHCCNNTMILGRQKGIRQVFPLGRGSGFTIVFASLGEMASRKGVPSINDDNISIKTKI
jgi:hypothetical protein